ncbi:hypothetical protein F7R25_21345 [Burkholderia stagnalis]|uniref:Transposase n=1 Tax=Burkholderia stagnalis TaxID=1503054 RepID=A0A6L3MT62_9BURK|nr:hypothetical protein F7R25_21345 [Burkholderia stagnalis]
MGGSHALVAHCSRYLIERRNSRFANRIGQRMARGFAKAEKLNCRSGYSSGIACGLRWVRRIDASTHRRIDVSTHRRIDAIC